MKFKSLLGLALAASVIFAAAEAGAQTGKPGGAPNRPSAAPRSNITLRFDAKSCTASDRAIVTEAFALAIDHVAVGIRHVRETPNSPQVNTWFGSASRKQITTVLEAVARRLAQPESFTVSCNDNLCRQGPMAYTVPSASRMGFCQGFFRASLTGEDSRTGTVVHEMSHLAARTQDHMYGRTRTRGLSAKQPDVAANNADNYEYFIETLNE